MMTTNLVPEIGTKIPISAADVAFPQSGGKAHCRITFDEHAGCWIIASRFSVETQRWVALPRPKLRGRPPLGLVVFLNDVPTPSTTHIVISSIQPSGKGAFADVA